jgi:hypothetical protein
MSAEAVTYGDDTLQRSTTTKGLSDYVTNSRYSLPAATPHLSPGSTFAAKGPSPAEVKNLLRANG